MLCDVEDIAVRLLLLKLLNNSLRLYWLMLSAVSLEEIRISKEAKSTGSSAIIQHEYPIRFTFVDTRPKRAPEERKIMSSGLDQVKTGATITYNSFPFLLQD